jgi:hypothetical protein
MDEFERIIADEAAQDAEAEQLSSTYSVLRLSLGQLGVDTYPPEGNNHEASASPESDRSAQKTIDTFLAWQMAAAVEEQRPMLAEGITDKSPDSPLSVVKRALLISIETRGGSPQLTEAVEAHIHGAGLQQEDYVAIAEAVVNKTNKNERLKKAVMRSMALLEHLGLGDTEGLVDVALSAFRLRFMSITYPDNFSRPQMTRLFLEILKDKGLSGPAWQTFTTSVFSPKADEHWDGDD